MSGLINVADRRPIASARSHLVPRHLPLATAAEDVSLTGVEENTRLCSS